MRLSCRGSIAFALSLLAAASPCAAQTPPPAEVPKIAWETDFDAAMERAKKQGKPIFVAFLMDDEPANDETIKKHYTNPEIAKLAAKFVCLACCTGEHHGEGDGCTKFPGTTCAQHQAIEKAARARWLTGENVCTPQHVFCDPNGQEITRKIYFVSPETLRKCFAVALAGVTNDPDARQVVDAERAVVDKWLKDIDSKNLEVRETAMRALSVAEDERALPAILRAAKPDNDDMIRLGAINALAKKGNFAAVKPLVGMLGDNKAQLVIAIAKALETIQLPEATAGVMAALKKEKRDRVRGFMLRAAARSSPGNDAVREACLQALKGASAQLEPCVLVALGRTHPSPQTVEAMKRRLTDKNQNTRGLAVWVLGSQGTAEGVAAIQDLLRKERTPEVIKMANSALEFCRKEKKEKVDSYETLYSMFFSDWDY